MRFCELSSGVNRDACLGNSLPCLRRKMVKVKMDPFPVGATTSALLDFNCHRTGNHVARCKILGSWSIPARWRFSHDIAYAALRTSRKREGITMNIYGMLSQKVAT